MARARLLHNATNKDGSKEWKQRGTGPLKLNVQFGEFDADEPEAGPTGKPKARLILRADGIGKVVLNSPIQKDLAFGQNGQKPKDGAILFQGVLESESQPQIFMLRVSLRCLVHADPGLLPPNTSCR